MFTQQWPNTRITLFEITRQSATQRRDNTSWEEASEFLCIKTPPFLREFSNKKSAKKPRNALSGSDVLLMSPFPNFAAGAAKKKSREARFQGFNWSVISGPKILRSCLLHWYACTCICICVCMNACICARAYVSICTYVCLCTCLHIHVYTHACGCTYALV